MTATLPRRPLDRRVNPRSPWLHVDWSLIFVILGISVFGVLMIYSSTNRALSEAGEDPYFYARRQVVFVVAGLGAMLIVGAFGPRLVRDFASVLYCGALVGLLGVLLVGTEVNGARSWFQLPGFQAQPSEFAKPIVIAAIAAYFAAHEGDIPLHRFARALTLGALPMLLILAQPDVGTMLVYAAIVMGTFLLGGAKIRHIVLASVIAVAGISVVLGLELLPDAQQARLTAFFDNEAPPQLRYNAEQAEIAIGHGGFSGTGYLEGSQTSLDFVPEQHTDFIFTAVGEEFGFVGSCALLLAYSFVMFRLWRIARLGRNLFETVLVGGILAMFVFHVFQNVGMTVGIMPITGIPLPFMSHGGSATIAMFAAIGLAIGVHARRWT